MIQIVNAQQRQKRSSLWALARHRFFTTKLDQICELAASNIRYGAGATSEVGHDLRYWGASRVVIFTDPTVRTLSPFQKVVESLDHAGLHFEVYDQVRIEPSDASFQHAINFLSNLPHKYDAIVAVGGGSVLDTAKAANLYATFPPNDFYDYVNPPVGKGIPVPATAELPPLIAIPTTAGTGSETTGVAIFDDLATKSKTGIASRRLKPTLGIIDVENTVTLPKEVATYCGLDVLCHAIESYTALPFNQRPKPASPALRPAYQGSNPISDVWALFALKTAANALPAAIQGDESARSQMLLASSAAGVGFGNAGVHLCHGMSYTVSSQVKQYKPASGYLNVDHPIVPHGLSVVVNAPAVFRFTGVACPERHATCARMLAKARIGHDDGSPLLQRKHWTGNDAGVWLSDEILDLTHRLGVTMGLRNLGYTEDDVPRLMEGTLPQHRVTKISPRPVGPEELTALFLDAMDE